MKKSIRRRKSSISEARSYAAIGRFWDKHDLGKFWHRTQRVKATITEEKRRQLNRKERIDRKVD